MSEVFNQDLDPIKLLSSKNFNNIVNVIIYRLGNFNEDIKSDIRQACALAVLKSIENYDPKKNNKFWVYALTLMKEYAKNELNLHKNIVHIPYNHINKGFKKYENISYDYESLEIGNNGNIPHPIKESDRNMMIDLQNAIDSLGSPTSDIVKMRIGLKETINGKNDFTSIGQTVNMPMHKVRNIYIESKKDLEEYLKDYLI